MDMCGAGGAALRLTGTKGNRSGHPLCTPQRLLHSSLGGGTPKAELWAPPFCVIRIVCFTEA